MDHYEIVTSKQNYLQSLGSPLKNDTLVRLFLIRDTARDLPNPHFVEEHAEPYRRLERDRQTRNTSIMPAIPLKSQLFWLLFVPTLVFSFSMLCQWLLVIILVAAGLCWWPFLVVATSSLVHVIAALVFVRQKTIGRESVAVSTLLTGLFIVAFIFYILCLAIEAPALCLSVSLKEKLILSTSNASSSILLNSIEAKPKHHFSLLFPYLTRLYPATASATLVFSNPRSQNPPPPFRCQK